MTQLNFSIAASLPQPAPNWMFRVRMPQEFGTQRQANVLQRVTTLIRPEEVIAESVSFSIRHSQALQRFQYGKQVNFAGFTEVPQCTMNFYETLDYRTMQYFTKWTSFVFKENERGLVYYPSYYYKREIIIDIYEDLQTDKPVVTVKLIGAWPGELSGFEYSFAEDGRIVISCPINIDDVSVNTNEQNQDRELTNAVLSSIGLR